MPATVQSDLRHPTCSHLYPASGRKTVIFKALLQVMARPTCLCKFGSEGHILSSRETCSNIQICCSVLLNSPAQQVLGDRYHLYSYTSRHAVHVWSHRSLWAHGTGLPYWQQHVCNAGYTDDPDALIAKEVTGGLTLHSNRGVAIPFLCILRPEQRISFSAFRVQPWLPLQQRSHGKFLGYTQIRMSILCSLHHSFSGWKSGRSARSLLQLWAYQLEKRPYSL